MGSDRGTQIIAAVLAVGLLVGVNLMTPGIAQRFDDLQLGADVQQAEDLPPAVRLATAAGGLLRGMAVQFLWHRVNQEKEEGRYFAVNQLSQTITALQPYYAQVWSFHAWNMAYNVSVTTHTPQERWDWVYKGVTLLRDQGIPYNPRAVRLYRELGWIYFHKIGGRTDDMHWHYKVRTTVQWQEILGKPDRGASAQQQIDAFARIVDMPDTSSELLEQYPQVEPLVMELDRLGYELNQPLLRGIGRINMFGQVLTETGMQAGAVDMVRDVDPQLSAVVRNEAYAESLPVLVDFLRKRVLQDDYHMEPAFMLELMVDDPDDPEDVAMGPLDWRHWACHGLYWSAKGVERAKRVRNRTDVDWINTYRHWVHATQDLFHNGRLNFDPITGRFDMMPEPRFARIYTQVVEKAAKDAEEYGFREGAVDRYAAGHENLMLRAMMWAYIYGNDQLARDYYRELRERFGDRPQNVRTGRYQLPLEDLVLRQLRLHWDMTENLRAFIDGMLVRAIDQGLGQNDVATFNRFVGLARMAYQKQEDRSIATPIAPQRRMALAKSFSDLVSSTYSRYMAVRVGDPMTTTLAKARVWRSTPEPLKNDVYASLEPFFQRLCQLTQLDPDKAFPKPEGWTPQRAAEAAQQRRQGDQPDGQRDPDQPAATIERQ